MIKFYNNAKTLPVRKVTKQISSNFLPYPKKIKGFQTVDQINEMMLKNNYYQINQSIAIHGGRINGLLLLKKIKKFRVSKKCLCLKSCHTFYLVILRRNFVFFEFFEFRVF